MIPNAVTTSRILFEEEAAVVVVAAAPAVAVAPTAAVVGLDESLSSSVWLINDCVTTDDDRER